MKKKNLIIMGLLLFSNLIGIVSAELGDYNCGGMMYSAFGGSGMMFFGWIIYLLVIGLIIAAIYWLVKNANKKGV